MSTSLKEHPKVLALVVVAALVFSAGVAYTYWPTGMPDMPETMEDVPALLESRAYANLSPDQRRPYVQRVSELMRTSDREQRRELMQSSDASRDAMRDMFRQMMLDRAKQFALADDATKRQMILEDGLTATRPSGLRFSSSRTESAPGSRARGGRKATH